MRALWPTLTILLLALLTYQSMAQRPDVRVSPPDPTTKAIPADIQIQSAEQIGTHTLVVWGTTRADGDSVVPTLRMQMLEGSNPSGEQIQLTSDTARPGRFVQVIPLDTCFAVVWNDAQIGMHIRYVGISGALLDKEQRISDGKVIQNTTYSTTILGSESSGRLLLWQDARIGSPGLYAIHLELNHTGHEQRLGSSLADLYSYSALPGWTLLHTKDDTWIAIDHDGQIDTRSLPPEHFNTTFYLNPDTSLVNLTSDTLQFFASIFDKEPEHVFRIEALDSAMPNSAQLGRDSAGALLIYFTRVTITGNAQLKGYYWIQVYKIRITGEDSTVNPKQVFISSGEAGPPYTGRISTTGLENVAYSPGCENSSRVNLVMQTTEYYHGRIVGSGTYTLSFSVDSSGLFYGDGRGYMQYKSSSSAVEAIRLSDTSASSINVVLIDTSLVLRAESGLMVLNYNQISPVIYQVNEKVMTTWQQAEKQATFHLSEWKSYNQSPALLRDIVYAIDMPNPQYPQFSVTQDGIAEIKLSNDNAITGVVNNRDLIINHPDRSLISSQKSIFHHGTLWISPITGFGSEFNWNRYVLRLADTTSWITLLSLSSAPDFNRDPRLTGWQEGILQGYDPGHGVLLLELVSFSRSSPPYQGIVRSLYAFGPDGKQQWLFKGLDQSNVVTTILPGDSLQFIRINGEQAALYQLQNVVGTFTFAQPGILPHYQRLIGPTFLRRYWTDSTGTDLRLELYTLDGTLLHATTIRHHSRNDDMLILQRPSDSAIAIISGSGHGVQLTALNNQLEMLAENVTISETHDIVVHPSATFRNDTLFFIWQDNRNGNADIYGNATAWKDLVGTAEDSSLTPTTPLTPIVPSQSQSTLHTPIISPNPAHNAVIIELDAEQGTHVVAEIFTMLGEVVSRKEINAAEKGRSYLQLDLRGLPDGAYMVRYRNGDTIGTLPLRIIQ